MSTSSQATLGAIRVQSQQRADLENNNSVSTPEWNQYISQSYKELFDILVGVYGNDYHVATTYQFSLNGSQLYNLPDGTPTFQNTDGTTAQKFYKMLGVDLQYSAAPGGYVSLRRFEFLERNKYAYPNSAINFNGYSNLRYRIEGDKLMFIPAPMGGQIAQLWYIPAPTSLQYMLPCTTTAGTSVLTLNNADTTGLAVGMNAFSSAPLNVVPANVTILSISSTTVTVSSTVTATQSSAIFSFWSDSARFDGISGWEEYVVIDAAIKAQIKQEEDFQGLLMQKQSMALRIEAMAEGRDAGQAQHVTDALSINSYGLDGYGGDGGMGGGW